MSKPLRWLGGIEIKSPPIGEKGRRSLGAALRVLQEGGQLSMPVFPADAVDRPALS